MYNKNKSLSETENTEIKLRRATYCDKLIIVMEYC